MAKKKTEIQELSEFIRDHMLTKEDAKDFATKDDLAALETRLTIKIDRLEISITRELDDIKKQLANVIGFRKEIDHALERIAAIEKHLGIQKKIAA